MRHLFDVWPEFTESMRGASHVLLLADYDGTLTPIVGRPEDALLGPEMKSLLVRVTSHGGFSVGIISGRALADIRQMAGLSGLYYAGNHGLEIGGPGLEWTSPEAEASRAEISALASKLEERLAGVSGVIIEDKGLSLSLHYRLVAENEVEAITAVFQELAAPFVAQGRLKMTTGKKVFEARPPIDWHKGKAVAAIRQRIKTSLGTRDTAVIYLGDDVTDEDAFSVLQRPWGWSIYVGGENQDSAAQFYLTGTGEVAEFLARLLEIR